MAARFIAFALFLCGAEFAASWWVWGRAPTDSIRVWYSGFWVFEAGRLHYWVPVFSSLLAIWIAGWYALRRHGRSIMWWLFAAALGVGLEVLTSALYWMSARSCYLRNLFQSICGSERESDKEAISCGFRYGLKSHEFDVRHGDPFGL
jgi:hypothetical protein